MPTLTRKTDQKIVIEHGGQTVTIMVTEIRQGRVKLLVEGPLSFSIRRAEVAPEQPEQQRYHGLLRERLRRERKPHEKTG